MNVGLVASQPPTYEFSDDLDTLAVVATCFGYDKRALAPAEVVPRYRENVLSNRFFHSKLPRTSSSCDLSMLSEFLLQYYDATKGLLLLS